MGDGLRFPGLQKRGAEGRPRDEVLLFTRCSRKARAACSSSGGLTRAWPFAFFFGNSQVGCLIWVCIRCGGMMSAVASPDSSIRDEAGPEDFWRARTLLTSSGDRLLPSTQQRRKLASFATGREQCSAVFSLPNYATLRR